MKNNKPTILATKTSRAASYPRHSVCLALVSSLACSAALAQSEAETAPISSVDYSLSPAPVAARAVSSETNAPAYDNHSFSLQTDSSLNFSFTRHEQEDHDEHWVTSIQTNSAAAKVTGDLPMTRLHSGLSYTAGLQIDSRKGLATSTEFVSSRQLGVHYGRLGSINYSGLDFGVERGARYALDDEKSLWSLGVTTGKRFALTGLEAGDPIWTLSLRGQFNYEESLKDEILPDHQAWYFSPGLHWERDSFRMSADVLMPFMQTGDYENEDSYSVRAKIIKRF